jgi:uncharacterized membrane protein
VTVDSRVLPGVARWMFVCMGLLPWVVPFLRAWRPNSGVGDALDFMFITMCHRLPERTLSLAGVAMPVCSRCAGIFAGVAAGALVARPRISAPAWRWAMTAGLGLMGLDVATQDLGMHPVWHATRLASGAIFGYALAAASVIALQRDVVDDRGPIPPRKADHP